MWNNWFGRKSQVQDVKNDPPPPEIVYFLEGTLRVPLEFPSRLKKDLPSLRQWVFDSIARLPLEEDIEYYTFKVLPDGYLYWYSLYQSKKDDIYGMLMKYDSATGTFTGISQNEELPLLQPPRRVEEQGDKNIFVDEDNKNNTLSVAIATDTPQTLPKRPPSKRSRSKK